MKTPFEIRLELLKLATEILTTEALTRQSDAKERWFYLQENARQGGTGAESLTVPDVPELPTVDQVIEQAQRMNQFVSSNDRLA